MAAAATFVRHWFAKRNPCKRLLRPRRHARRENHISSCNQSGMLCKCSILRVWINTMLHELSRRRRCGKRRAEIKKINRKLCWHQENSNQLNAIESLLKKEIEQSTANKLNLLAHFFPTCTVESLNGGTTWWSLSINLKRAEVKNFFKFASSV
jgi:hypothetical protein